MDDARSIQQVLARYVRATDRRDGTAMSALFLDDATVEIFYGQAEQVALGTLEGAAAIGQAVGAMMAPHPRGGWSHHTTHDPIVEIDGDEASIDAQFIVYNTRAAERPLDGWPAGAAGAQGSVQPIEAGYYRANLVRHGGEWKIARHRIFLDLPHAFAGA